MEQVNTMEKKRASQGMDTEKYHEPGTAAGAYGQAGAERDRGAYSMKQVEVRLKLQDAQPLYSTDPIDDPESAARVMADLLAGLDREYMCVVNLDSKLRPINFNVVSIGDINQTYVPVQNVFKSAILSNAASILAMHNHPSGIAKPSGADLEVTSRLIDAGRLMNIGLEDHIIVGAGNGELYSFRQNMPDLFRNYGADITKSWETVLGSCMDESGGHIAEKHTIGKEEKNVPEDVREETEAKESAVTQAVGDRDADTAQELAKRIDAFMYEYDKEGYEATVTDRTAQEGNMAEDIRTGNAGYLSGFLAEVMGQSGSMEEIREAASLLVMLSDYKPLAKVEELEEENLNQIDNVISNTVPKAEKKREERQEEEGKAKRNNARGATRKRRSLKERLAEKRAALAAARKPGQTKERESAAGIGLCGYRASVNSLADR